MKINDFKQLRTKSVSDLTKLVLDKRKKLVNVQVDMQAGREKNLKLAKNIRLEIAKLLTILKEVQLVSKEKKAIKLK